MKIIFLILFSATLFFPQGITDKHKSVIARMNVESGGVPSYEDTLFAYSGTSLTCCDGTNFAESGKTKNGNDLTPDADYVVKRIQIYIGSITGDISSLEWKFGIQTMSGNNLSTGYLGYTNTITGVSTGWTEIATFTSDITLTSGTKYGIYFMRADSSYDASNHPNLTYGAGSGSDWTPTGEVANSFYWQNDGTYTYGYTGEWSIKLYGDASP